MNNDEFESIMMDKYSPDLVYNTDEDELYYNNFTCYGSYYYGGTCNCISHPVKEWIKFTNQLIEILE